MTHAAPTPQPRGRWGQQADQGASQPTPPAPRSSQSASPADSPVPQAQATGGWGSGAQQSPAAQLPSYGQAQPPRATTSSVDLSVLHNKWVITGVSAVLGILFVISYLLNWAHSPGDEVTINGLGFVGGTLPGDSGMLGNIFIFPALAILIGLGTGAYHLGFTHNSSRGYKEMFTAGAVAAVLAIFGLATKMLLSLFVSFTSFDGTTVEYETASGPGPVLCLFLAVVTLAFAGVLYVTRPQVQTPPPTPFGGPVPGQPFPNAQPW
ncbi:hypothetical protein [uncultured Corynebacterium sp.]|uniref:hypothetical protein n=1 Tax=uncultured Corynebacterium sp. TaxID=159447 RepID=UPI0025F61B19|nr:hypothetical protein [uncultured Corynebacterium sp.]